EQRKEPQLIEAIRMAETVRHILLDNNTIPTAAGSEQVFQVGYRDMRIVFDTLIQNFEEEFIGIKVAVLSAHTVFAELGY
ncbi:unnamed protein product, partial [marine sediment metagenome]